MSKHNKHVEDFDRSANAYMREIVKYEPLSVDEEFNLWKRYKTANDLVARDKLITANLKFVTNVAKKYRGYGLSFSDLVAEGNMGLIKSMDRFNGKKGYKFITYAVWWIRQTILEALNKRNLLDSEALPEEYEPQISDDEGNLVDNECTISSFICDESMSGIKENEEKEALNLLLDCLNEKERYVVSEYYGLNDGEPKTLEKIGEKLNLTKERIRQINNAAFKKLRVAAITFGIDETIYR